MAPFSPVVTFITFDAIIKKSTTLCTGVIKGMGGENEGFHRQKKLTPLSLSLFTKHEYFHIVGRTALKKKKNRNIYISLPRIYL